MNKGRNKVITLRNFLDGDAPIFQEKHSKHLSIEEIRDMFRKWNKKEYEGKYFEMFAIVKDEDIVGRISLYQHSENVISCGPEIFEGYRRQGFAKEAMLLAMDIAKGKGYKVVMQQIRVDNVASVALHNSLGFETDGYVYRNKKGNEVLIYLKVL